MITPPVMASFVDLPGNEKLLPEVTRGRRPVYSCRARNLIDIPGEMLKPALEITKIVCHDLFELIQLIKPESVREGDCKRFVQD